MSETEPTPTESPSMDEVVREAVTVLCREGFTTAATILNVTWSREVAAYEALARENDRYATEWVSPKSFCDAVDAALARAESAESRALAAEARCLPHGDPATCSFWYDGCHCQEVLDADRPSHAVRASAASSALETMRAALAELVGSCDPDGSHPAHPWMRYTAALRDARAALGSPSTPARSCLWHSNCDAADRALRPGVAGSHPPAAAPDATPEPATKED